MNGCSEILDNQRKLSGGSVIQTEMSRVNRSYLSEKRMKSVSKKTEQHRQTWKGA